MTRAVSNPLVENKQQHLDMLVHMTDGADAAEAGAAAAAAAASAAAAAAAADALFRAANYE
jgi:hypothetical protein